MAAPNLEPELLDGLDAKWAYSDAEWQEAAGHDMFAAVDDDAFLGLVTHMGWTDAARKWFNTLMELEAKSARDSADVGLHEPWAGAMFVYYGLFWAVIEACRVHRVPFMGILARDIRAIAKDMNHARNAVFHVGKPESPKLYDSRLDRLLGDRTRQSKIESAYLGIRRALMEEIERRRASLASDHQRLRATLPRRP